MLTYTRLFMQKCKGSTLGNMCAVTVTLLLCTFEQLMIYELGIPNIVKR